MIGKLVFIEIKSLLYFVVCLDNDQPRDRPGTKFSRGRGRDQVESAGAGINRDFEMLPRPGPGLAKICRGRDFLI